MLVRCLASLLSGLALAAAFEPIGWAWLMPLCIATLVLSVRGVKTSRAWLPALVFGVAFIFSVMVWMRAVGTDAWLAMCTLEALFFIPLGLGLSFSLRHRGWPVWTALWWVGIETLRSQWPFSGMPFGRLAFATADTPWAEALPWVGMTGVSLLVALTGTTTAWLLTEGRSRPRRSVVAVAALSTVTLFPTLVSPVEVSGDDVKATVAAVQGNVPGDGTDVVGFHREITANHVVATTELAERVAEGTSPAPDFVVWPENSTAVDPFSDAGINAGIRTATEAIEVPIMVGGMADDPLDDTQVLNQGIVFRPGLGGGDRYTKRHPVPYGEYIPFRDSLMPSNYGKLRMIPRDMARGTDLEPLDVAGVLVADAICFDVAYDEGIAGQVVRGAQLVTVQTSNAMFSRTAQLDQQFEISRLRALETHRWVVVAAINGISGVVAPDGTVVTSAGARTQAVLVETVSLHSSLTPAVRLGSWPARMTMAFVATHAFWGVLTYRRRRAGDRRPPKSSEQGGNA